MFFSVFGKFLSFSDKKIRKNHRKNLKGEKSGKNKEKNFEGWEKISRKILELEKN